ncbi:lasso peptide biosynthesis B2 protein [Bacillus cereus group sp. BY9-3LC]|uniref:lasso peptide biosynthesis B2 protein n=1 Tax=Bacillus cereus group sp. BY9-3LC TaxID=3018075 RepID=UPI0022E6729D|nr:lasso peptide biosynthesis B2 protein [Bacillus cereus group sp. BY9-3LC]MDA1778503.1 lasso peptide biosynthesis B2 protein [Bacillus cereus group sp. BY9-3LC]
MNIVRKIRKFFLLDMKTMFLFIEAYMYLGWARFLKSMPFSKIAPTLGTHMDETSLNCNESNKLILGSISEAIHIMSQHTFWESKCLVSAIAGMEMLKRRQIESTLYLGTAKDKDGKMLAHAWLRSGPFYITGAEEMERFTVVSKFARRIG